MYQHNVYDALRILQAGINAASPCTFIPKRIKHTDNKLIIQSVFGQSFKINLSQYERIYIVGAGKATAFMAKALLRIMGERVTQGYIIVNYGNGLHLKDIECSEAGHPIPDGNGLKYTKRLVELLRDCKERDLVLCLLSGGASSLLVYPKQGISLHDLQVCNRIMISSGANIQEINMIRRAISSIKGGGLARIAHPAKVISLILSDVIGDSPSDIGSGPTYSYPINFIEVKNIIETYDLTKRLPKSILKVLDSGNRNLIHYSERVIADNIIISNNSDALESAERTARKLGYLTNILSSELCGRTQDVSRQFVDIAKRMRREKDTNLRPICVLAGGETTVTVSGNGLGGRNQELVLSFLEQISGLSDFLFMSCGTDGIDGPTDAAGAYVNDKTIQYIQENNINVASYLSENDSYRFFEKVGGLIKTGPTGTNVMDLHILILA
jgi:glycerate 2-kinase